jgi:surface carbohydrate biosynthesis protein
MISKFRRIIRVLRNTRILFRFPKRTSIIQIHKDGLEILALYVDRSAISVVDPSELNLWILLKCFFSAKFHLHEYIVEMIKIQNPRVVITFIDNDPNFYLLKSHVSSPAFIAVQNGIRNNYSYVCRDGFIDRLEKLGETRRLRADMICTFGKSSSILFERHIQTRTLITGNIKNNLMEIASPIDPEFDIVFMSQHAPFDLKNRPEVMHLNSASLPIQKFYEIEGTVAKFLAQYCDEHSLRFAVSGKRGIEDAYEQHFFSNAIGKIPHTFLPRINPHSSYENGLNSHVVVVVDSTIGYELLSRGRKVAFFSARMFNPSLNPNELKDSFFGYPNSYPDSGPFWTNQPDLNDYSRILHDLMGMTQAEWAAQIQPYTEDLMAYRPGNSEFIQMLKNAGIKATSEVVSRA